jgi:hypothetical protein
VARTTSGIPSSASTRSIQTSPWSLAPSVAERRREQEPGRSLALGVLDPVDEQVQQRGAVEVLAEAPERRVGSREQRDVRRRVRGEQARALRVAERQRREVAVRGGELAIGVRRRDEHARARIRRGAATAAREAEAHRARRQVAERATEPERLAALEAEALEGQVAEEVGDERHAAPALHARRELGRQQSRGERARRFLELGLASRTFSSSESAAGASCTASTSCRRAAAKLSSDARRTCTMPSGRARRHASPSATADRRAVPRPARSRHAPQRRDARVGRPEASRERRDPLGAEQHLQR